jgi:hypothetical protein
MTALRRASALMAGLLLALLGFVQGAAAAPLPCSGSGWVAPIVQSIEVRQMGQVTETTFDYFGQHPICLADGQQVTGDISGRLVQRNGPGGSLGLQFDEVLSYGGGALGYRGDATYSSTGWTSHVRTVGDGSGPLAGIEGQGAFSPIDPGTGGFSDQIFYVYH